MENISPIRKDLLLYDVTIQDYNVSQYIKIYDIPQIMGLGKHSFLLWINNSKFMAQSNLQLQILDSENMPINYTIPPFVQSGMRRISLDITQTTANGVINIVFIGTVFVNSSPLKINNYRFITTSTVNKAHKNYSSIRFNNQPSVSITQITKPLLNFTEQYNGIVWNSNTSSSVDTHIDLNTYKISQTITMIISQYNNDKMLLTVSSGSFDKSFLNQRLSIYNDSNLKYQFKISDIISNSTVKLQNIGANINYIENENIVGYTASVSHIRNIPDSNINTAVDYNGNILYNSILNININNFDTFSGKVGTIKTYYKKMEDQSDNYKLLGQVNVQSQNILVSQSESDIMDGIGILEAGTSEHWFGFDISNQTVVDITQDIRDRIIHNGQIIGTQEVSQS